MCFRAMSSSTLDNSKISCFFSAVNGAIFRRQRVGEQFFFGIMTSIKAAVQYILSITVRFCVRRQRA